MCEINRGLPYDLSDVSDESEFPKSLEDFPNIILLSNHFETQNELFNLSRTYSFQNRRPLILGQPFSKPNNNDPTM